MCGIAGWFGSDSGMDANTLVQALHHRGPDGSGIWQSVKATLVHTRLAIIDLSEAGKQPMEHTEALKTGERKAETVSVKPASRTGAQSVLVFNGEIYNHAELRAELEEQGEVFVGHSDTEVLLRLLVRDGEACLAKLVGMFAFAFWDELRGLALCVRDAYGVKPLFYRQQGGNLSFASESRVLRRDDDVIDETALRDFFLWGSICEPQTLHTGIRQLPAGHLLRWQENKFEIERWHHSPPPGREYSMMDRPEVVRWTRAALEQSLRRHLVSDVPVGIFLSGGIDSTVILALSRKVLGPAADIRTFSIGFDDPEFDESSVARMTAEYFGARHTEWRMTEEDGTAEVPGYLTAADQPSIDGFNTWCVSKLARREGMKVVLSGLGGDEWFAGYGSFVRVPQFQWLHAALGPLRAFAGILLQSFPPSSRWRRLGVMLRGSGTPLEAFHAQRGIFTVEEADRMATALTSRQPAPPDWNIPLVSSDPRAVVSELELTRYMRNQLLRDSDVFSMAHGLELRVPLVDVRLGDMLLGLPPSIRLQQGKQLLLDAVPEIPEWVRDQPKRGFRFPFQQWIEGQLGDLLAEAGQKSPVALETWYRSWAVSLALSSIRK